jgi:hypothetical protein
MGDQPIVMSLPPSKSAQAVTFITIREVSCSDLGRDTYHPDVFVVFLSPFSECWNMPTTIMTYAKSFSSALPFQLYRARLSSHIIR